MRGLVRLRVSIEPTPLPIPSPIRNTARMIENVYTVAPRISDKILVQITSAPNADMPDRAMATYTDHFSAAAVPAASPSWVSPVRCVATDAMASPITATMALMVAATYVATITSWILNR